MTKLSRIWSSRLIAVITLIGVTGISGFASTVSHSHDEVGHGHKAAHAQANVKKLDGNVDAKVKMEVK